MASEYPLEEAKALTITHKTIHPSTHIPGRTPALQIVLTAKYSDCLNQLQLFQTQDVFRCLDYILKQTNFTILETGRS